MKMLAVCCLLLSALCLRAELAFKWTVEVSQALPYAAEALQGESFNLEAKVVQYRVPMMEAAEATFYYQTPEMEASQWYTVPAAWDATTATASVAFTPAMDVGSTKYRFFFGIETAQGKNYRVFGTLRLKASPGFSPATLEPTDVRAEMIQEILEAVFEESDERYATKAEHAALAVQVQGKADASHTHSDLQQSATVLLQAINSEAQAREMADAEIVDALEGKVSYLRTAPAAPSNNANCYGYRGTLKALGVTGSAALVRRLSILTRASGNQNVDVPLWARIVRNEAGAWKVVAQAKEPRKWSDVSAGSELSWEMAPVAGASLPGTSDAIAIVWVNSETAAANVSHGPVSFQTIALSGGLQYALPTSASTSSSLAAWSPRITLEYTEAYAIADAELSAISTNPVSAKAVKAALDKKMDASPDALSVLMRDGFGGDNGLIVNGTRPWDDTHYHLLAGYGLSDASPNSGFFVEGEGEAGVFLNYSRYVFTPEMFQGGGNTEVWKGNVGFGEQDTFFGPKKVADGEGQFLNGYPRLHNHGQDIHEVSGFSRDSRDDESVWSHRLLLPWDLAKANDTSYLMAGVVWNGQRNLFANGDTATFVQPLLPQNSGSTQSALPYAIPCFENSPVYWKGTIIWNDGTKAVSKAVQIPWARVKQDVRGPDELALKRDIPSIDAALSTTSTNPVQNKVIKAALDTTAAVTFGSMPSVSLGKDGKYFTIQSADVVGQIGAEITYPNGTKVVLVKAETVMDLATRVNALESAAPSEPEARTSHALSWQANTSLLTVTPNADGEVVFDPTDWPEGQSLLVRLTTPEDFGGVPASVRLVGYFDLEPSSTYQLTAYVVGGTLHVVPLLREE